MNLLGPLLLGEDDLVWEMEGACSGECCRIMTLSISPERIAVAAARIRYARKMGRRWVPPRSDVEFVEENFSLVRYSSRDGITGRPRPRAAQYRCKLWKDGRCSQCASRPWFCRTWGVERYQQCPRPDCSLKVYPRWYHQDRWADDGGPPLPQSDYSDYSVMECADE